MVGAVSLPSTAASTDLIWMKYWLQLKDKPVPPLLEGCGDADVIAM